MKEDELCLTAQLALKNAGKHTKQDKPIDIKNLPSFGEQVLNEVINKPKEEQPQSDVTMVEKILIYEIKRLDEKVIKLEKENKWLKEQNEWLTQKASGLTFREDMGR